MGNDETLAYLAGFFDGEGCVGIYNRKDRPSQKQIRVSVAQVDKSPIDLFQSVFGGNIGMQRASGHGTKPLYRLQYTGERAKDVLANLYPYLRVKREGAALALEFVNV